MKYNNLQAIIKISFRNLTRERKISILNLFGLSIGMSVAILIFYFVQFERSYDSFHKNRSLIYRIISVNKSARGTELRGTTPLPFPEAVSKEIKAAEITTSLTHFLNEDEPVRVADKFFFNLIGYTADPSFLKMFNFPMIAGNPGEIFNDPGSIVITQSTARKLFGEENPLGKELMFSDFNFTVSGVMEDLPENSIFRFDLLISHLILRKIHPDLENMWWAGGSQTFIKTYASEDAGSVKSDLAKIPGKYFPDYLKGRESYDIQPLQSIHLDTRVTGDVKPPVSNSYLNILMLIAISVLCISCANFITLSISQSEKRAKETGLRKLAGASRFHLICVFVGEAVILSMIAVVFAILLTKLALPWFNVLSQRNISINFNDLSIILSILLLGTVTGILTGFYPALIFSGSQPAHLLRSGIKGSNKTGFRKVFVTAQFMITIILIISELIITRQISFMKNHALGFNENNLITIPLRVRDESKRLEFAKVFGEKIEMEAKACNIEGISLTENIPGQNFPNRFAVVPEGTSPDDSKEMVVTSIDENFSDVFQVDLVKGRILTDTIASDRFNNVMINEEAAKTLGWNDPVGKKLRFKHEETPLTIIGVMKDINLRSMQSSIEPVVYRYTGSNWLAGYITLRTGEQYYSQTINMLKRTWEEQAPGIPFQYFFIKDKYNEKYRDEERLAKIIGTFTVLAVFLSCLGLFALVFHLLIQRTKEICIRKINGARTAVLMFYLNSGYFKSVSVAFVIACPVAWYFMHSWLENFAYRIKISWWIFGLSGIVTAGIILLTVSSLTWRAANMNPVDGLRYE